MHDVLMWAVGIVVCTGIAVLGTWAAHGFGDGLVPPLNALYVLAVLMVPSALYFFWPGSLLPRTRAQADAALPVPPETELPSTRTSLARSIDWGFLVGWLVFLGVWGVFVDEVWWFCAPTVLLAPERIVGTLYWSRWERRRGKVLWVRTQEDRESRPGESPFAWSARTPL
ncbi:hypothetical protein ABT404_44880 [Streptomyces hyaluromycini]|uniref:Integral membrane protein n=1 Tax=Streptomyces hyaluromycini TaxID=1377993 RepID=A0ABV1XBX0_9ACTN